MTEGFLICQLLKCCILFFHSCALFFEGGVPFFKPEINHIYIFSLSTGNFSFVWNSSGLQYVRVCKSIVHVFKNPSQKRELVSSTDLKEVELKNKGPYIHNLEISKHSMRGMSCSFH